MYITIIKVGNEDKENVSWEKGVEDTFVVTYVLNPNENIANEDIKIIRQRLNKT